MRTLITGFEPFGLRKANMSMEMARKFVGRSGVDVLLLPVSFSRAPRLMSEQLRLVPYDWVIMLGETSATKDCIRLERVAVNLKDSVGADNDEVVADEEPIQPNGPNAYFTNVPIKQWCVQLGAEGYKVKVSNTAGTFVCNCLYYSVLQYIRRHRSPTRAVFVHLPASNEEISFDEMHRTIDAIILRTYPHRI